MVECFSKLERFHENPKILAIYITRQPDNNVDVKTFFWLITFCYSSTDSIDMKKREYFYISKLQETTNIFCNHSSLSLFQIEIQLLFSSRAENIWLLNLGFILYSRHICLIIYIYIFFEIPYYFLVSNIKIIKFLFLANNICLPFHLHSKSNTLFVKQKLKISNNRKMITKWIG